MSFDLTNPIYNDPEAARAHLEALLWPDGPACPHCGAYENIAKVEGTKKSHRPGLYYCNSCKGQFTVTVGTVIERSKIPLNKWVLGFHMMAASKKGVSAHQLHRMLGVTYKTAWFMAHRIREAMKELNPGPLGGEGQTVEADETHFGNTSRNRRKDVYVNGKGWVKRGGGQNKYKIVSLVERGGRARSVHVPAITANAVRDVLVRNADRKSHLMTDEANVYTMVGKEYASHQSVNHSEDEYVRGDVTTNTIESFFSVFKRGMRGVY